MSHDLVKESKTSSAASKADKKRSGKHKPAPHVASPYVEKRVNDSGDEDDYSGSNTGSAGTFIVFRGKELSFEDFIEALNDKYDRDEAIQWLFATKLKSYSVQQPPITPQMADDLLNGIRAAMGFGGGAGRKGNKGKTSSTDSVPNPETALARLKAVECGTALVICCGASAESRKLFDTWGAVLVSSVTSIIKGLRSQMEDFIHTSNTAEGPVKTVIASPSGITSSISAAQRKVLSEISGRCYDLLVRCFESLALLNATDPDMIVNEDNDSLPTALLQLANLVIPDFSSPSRELGNVFPTSDSQDSSFYLPIEACGALLKCLVSTCEPAQGSKARAVLLRLHRYVTGTTSLNAMSTYEDEDAEDDVSSSHPSDDGGASSTSTTSTHKGTFTGLYHTLISALAQSIGILGSRFPEMVAPDETRATPPIQSGVSSPTTQNSNNFTFSTTPLLSVEQHLVPLSKILAKKAMGRGKCRRDAQLLLRQAAKKLGSLNGSNIDSLEDHEAHRKRKSHKTPAHDLNSAAGSPTTKAASGKFPGSGGSTPPPRGTPLPENGELPSHNPNRPSAEDEDKDEDDTVISHTIELPQTDRADPEEVIQFRDKLSVTFVGFQQIYLASCLRSLTGDGLQRQLAQNPLIRHLFDIHEDLTRKMDRNERKEHLVEAEASKLEERRGRQKERDSKARAREYADEDY